MFSKIKKEITFYVKCVIKMMIIINKIKIVNKKDIQYRVEKKLIYMYRGMIVEIDFHVLPNSCIHFSYFSRSFFDTDGLTRLRTSRKSCIFAGKLSSSFGIA